VFQLGVGSDEKVRTMLFSCASGAKSVLQSLRRPQKSLHRHQYTNLSQDDIHRDDDEYIRVKQDE
jgi:hypothetical protein